MYLAVDWDNQQGSVTLKHLFIHSMSKVWVGSNTLVIEVAKSR